MSDYLEEMMLKACEAYDDTPGEIRPCILIPMVANRNREGEDAPLLADPIPLPDGLTPAHVAGDLNKIFAGAKTLVGLLALMDSWSYPDRIQRKMEGWSFEQVERFHQASPPSSFPDRVDTTSAQLVTRDGVKMGVAYPRSNPKEAIVVREGEGVAEMRGRQIHALLHMLGME